MAKCGVCGGGIANTLVSHGQICEDDRKSTPMPEIDDVIRMIEEDEEVGECDTCGGDYELASRDGRCGDCGDCSQCCSHKEKNSNG